MGGVDFLYLGGVLMYLYISFMYLNIFLVFCLFVHLYFCCVYL